MRLLLLLLLTRPDAVQLTPAAVQMGARVVAAEARGEDFAEQYAVAATVGNRVRSGILWWRSREHSNPWMAVMSGQLQYAPPAPVAAVRPEHQLAFILGALAPVGWSRRAVSFATRAAVKKKRLVEVWGSGYSPLEVLPATGRAHVFFGFASDT